MYGYAHQNISTFDLPFEMQIKNNLKIKNTFRKVHPNENYIQHITVDQTIYIFMNTIVKKILYYKLKKIFLNKNPFHHN